MGKVAAELLLDRINFRHKEEKTPRQIIIPVELIKRESAISLSSTQRR
jgi:DNA-binding LacI/PurR family transcriptional regulator